MSIKQRASDIFAEYSNNDELKILVTQVIFNVAPRTPLKLICDAVGAICGIETGYAHIGIQYTESSGFMYTSARPNAVITADFVSVATILSKYLFISGTDIEKQQTIEEVLRWNKLFGKPENIKGFHEIIEKL